MIEANVLLELIAVVDNRVLLPNCSRQLESDYSSFFDDGGQSSSINHDVVTVCPRESRMTMHSRDNTQGNSDNEPEY